MLNCHDTGFRLVNFGFFLTQNVMYDGSILPVYSGNAIGIYEHACLNYFEHQ